MIVLGIETAGPQGSVALLIDDEEPRQSAFAATKRLGADLAPAVRALLQEASLEAADLVVVDTGPGSYTGLRIGLAAAKGLAFAWGRPLLGVPATDALEAMAPPAERVLCALDASRGEVYTALYDRSGGAAVLTEPPRLRTTDELRAAVPARTLVVGDGAGPLVDDARGVRPAEPALEWPTAVEVARVGRARYLDGQREDALRLAPIYYRAVEAKKTRRKRSMKAS